MSWTEGGRRRHVEDVQPRFGKYLDRGFATPTGDVELASTVLEQLAYDPLPYYEPHP